MKKGGDTTMGNHSAPVAHAMDDLFVGLDAFEEAYEQGDPDTCAETVQRVLDMWAAYKKTLDEAMQAQAAK